VSIDRDRLLAGLDPAREAAEDRVVLEQVAERRRVGDVVDGHELELGARLVSGPEEVPPDPTEPVDPDLHCHLVPPWVRLRSTLQPTLIGPTSALRR
jgi:hypothetical protein